MTNWLKGKSNFLFLLLLYILLWASPLSAQIVLNEICPTNISGILNSNGQYDDWIELYNSGNSSVNLSGYGLSDDSTQLDKFVFSSYSVSSHAYVLVFASDINGPAIANHWESAVLATTTWKYFTGTSQPDTNWRNNSFNDGSWSSGAGGIGFGDGDDVTVIPTCKSVMMRKTFTIPDTSQIVKAVFNMDYDDGFVAFLNGVEIARANLGVAGDRPLYNVLASSSHEAKLYQGLAPDSFYIDPAFLKSILRQGTNVLAVEVHNQTATSNDLTSRPFLSFGMRTSGSTFSSTPSWFHATTNEKFNAKFKLSRNGEKVFLTNSSRNIIDQKQYPAFESNNSIGRSPNGNSTWCYFSTPTPAASNNGSTCYTGYASSPVFSVQPGFYSSTRTITLSTSTPGGVIRYTTNGDDPTSSSTRYTSSISVSQTKTIRAKVFASGYLSSPTITNTYFINTNLRLPIFTITTDSLNLWDYNTGIYVLGPNADANFPNFNANFWQDWKKPAAIEYYDKAKNRIIHCNSEIAIYGNYSRAKPQKSFEISLSDRLGTGSILYPLIPDKPYINNTNNIVLRNSGTDWNVTQFRDAFMERVMKKTRTGYLGTEPAVLFLNGQFWGVYTIHENHDHHWMQNNFGYTEEEIDYLKEDGSAITVKNGSDTGFWSMHNYATTQNAGTTQYYDYMNSVWDLGNYTDYFIAETYYNNGDWIGDWTNNIKIWRPRAPGSRWKYLLYDLDFGLGLQGSVNDNRLDNAIHPAAFSYSSNIFGAMLNNPKFKRDFINRYADLVNTIFLPSAMSSVMHQFQDSMSHDMSQHFAKWGSTVSGWQSRINSMMNFVNARPAIARNQIQSQFSLTGQVTLTLTASPAGSGRIQISTITPTSLPWSGVYFNGNPVTITAIPNPGYTFNHWRSTNTITSNNSNQSVTYNFTSADQITAYFTGSSATPRLNISEINYHSDPNYDSGDWIELHNFGAQSLDISGWSFMDENENHKFTFPVNTVIPAGAYLVLAEDLAKFSNRHPSVNNVIGPMGFGLDNNAEEIRILDYRDILYLSVNYQDMTPWPLQADGGGYTCELSTNVGDPNDGNNWFAGCIGGSPGSAFSNSLSVPVAVSGNTTFCSGGSVNLSATNVSGYTYQWQRNNANISGATSSTLHVTTAGSYTVLATFQGCTFLSSATLVNVVTNGPQPTVTPASRCGPGTITLIAASSDTVYWFDSPGGSMIQTGDSLVIPNLTSTTTYYAQSSLSCPSSQVPVQAIINEYCVSPVTTDTSRCGPGSVTLIASDTADIRWYALSGALLATGNTFVTNTISGDTSFLVEAGSVCPSPSIEVFVAVYTTPSPVVTSASRCGDGTVILTATSRDSIAWYDAISGGIRLDTGSIFQTPVLDTTTVYYAEAISICPSTRVPVDAIVNQIPDPPLSNDTAICGAGSVELSAFASEQIFWYDAPVGGNMIFSGSYLTTPVDSVTTTYYVECGYICRSSRIPVTLNVNHVPDPPVTQDSSRCGSGQLTLTATSRDSLSWFDNAAGGNLLNTGAAFVTPVLNNTTVYYVEAGTICPSSRIPVQAIVHRQSDPPVITNGSHCGPGPVTLYAYSRDSVLWYNRVAGGILLGSGNVYQTPSINASTLFYAVAGILCPSQPAAVQALVYTAPFVDLGPDTISLLSGQSTILDAGPGFASYHWSTGSVSDTLVVHQQSTYTVIVTDISGCSATDSVYVNVITGMKAIESVFSCTVFPNPVRDQLTVLVSSSRNELAKLRLFDATGRELMFEEMQVHAGRSSKEINLTGIARGIYLFRIDTPEISRIIRVIVE